MLMYTAITRFLQLNLTRPALPRLLLPILQPRHKTASACPSPIPTTSGWPENALPGMPTSGAGTYEDAVRLLDSRSCLKTEKRGEPANYAQRLPGGHENVPRWMRIWLGQLGFAQKTGDRFNVIHVTGTKGKGSTASLTESLLRAHYAASAASSPPGKPLTGLFTSPALTSPTERIRINGQPITRAAFASAIHAVWNALVARARAPTSINPHLEHRAAAASVFLPILPDKRQLVALASYLVFANAGIEVAVYEVFCGGRRDGTNFFDEIAVCGLLPIDVDHPKRLGATPTKNAWHKSGLMKPRTPVLVAAQSHAQVRACIEWEARDLCCPLELVTTDCPEVTALLPEDHPRLWPRVQKSNAAMALKLALACLRTRGDSLTRADVASGLDAWRWDGRFQVLRRDEDAGRVTWFLDCAHNALSMPVSAEWFGEATRREAAASRVARVLVFGHDSARGSHVLAASLYETCQSLGVSFDLVVMSPVREHQELGLYDEPWGHTPEVASRTTVPAIRTLSPAQNMVCADSIQHAASMAMEEPLEPRQQDDDGAGAGIKRHVYVVGSCHLVAGMLAILGG